MIVLFISIIFLAIHTFNLFSLNVDSTSIVLIILILISPFITSIKKLKYEINSEEIQIVIEQYMVNILMKMILV